MSAPSLHSLAYAYPDARLRDGSIAKSSARTLHYTLVVFVQTVGDRPASQLTRRHIEKWREARKLSPESLRSQLSIIRTWCDWMIAKGYLRRNPTIGTARVPKPRRLPRGLQAQQVAAGLAACPDARARLVLSLMAQEGLRCCEVAGLQLGDVDFGGRTIQVVGKGSHERLLPLTTETLEMLDAYLEEHPGIGGPLVRSYSRPTRGLTAKYISDLVSEWLHDGGVQASGHSLRHTAAGDVLRSGAHLRDVQAMLGHSSLATTQVYLPLLVGDLREAMDGRRYRGRAT